MDDNIVQIFFIQIFFFSVIVFDVFFYIKKFISDILSVAIALTFILPYWNAVVCVCFEHNARGTCFNRTVRFTGLHRLEKRSSRSKEKFFSDAVSAIDTSRHVLHRDGDEKHARYHSCEEGRTFRSRRKLQFKPQYDGIRRGITTFRSARLCNFSLGQISFPRWRRWRFALTLAIAKRCAPATWLIFLSFSFSSLFASFAITACCGNN